MIAHLSDFIDNSPDSHNSRSGCSQATPRIFGAGVIKQSLLIVQGLADHIAAQLWRVFVFPDYLDRFLERGQFDSVAHYVFKQVALPGLRIAPSLRTIAMNDGKQ